MNKLMQQADLMGVGSALVTGFLFSFNPTSFITIPVVLAYVIKARALQEALKLGGAFIFGMIVTHIFIGIGAAIGGEWASNILKRFWYVLLGSVLIIHGLIWRDALSYFSLTFSQRSTGCHCLECVYVRCSIY